MKRHSNPLSKSTLTSALFNAGFTGTFLTMYGYSGSWPLLVAGCVAGILTAMVFAVFALDWYLDGQSGSDDDE